VTPDRRVAIEPQLDATVGGLLRHRGPVGLGLRLVPLVLVVPPLLTFWFENPPAERLASLAPAVATFVGIVLWTGSAPSGALSRRARVATVLLTLLAVVVELIDPASHWLRLFFYPAIAGALVGSVREASFAILGVSTVAAAAAGAVMTDAANKIVFPLECALVGFGTLALVRLAIANRELAQARAEISRLAAAEERLRIARDLHDLLGQGLSVIALKAQLAGRLLHADAARAAKEVGDIESVSRRALEDVRAAVAGYRRLNLATELVGAQTALEAAGVATEVDHQAGSLPDEVGEAFAWSVREGVTNIIRHAAARVAVIRTRRDGRMALLEILDDGAPSTRSESPVRPQGKATGSGLAGLAERARAVGGRVDAERRPEGGFRLAVAIPVENARGDPATEDEVVSLTAH
jgi:two-component system sensor histidine kinase DesK